IVLSGAGAGAACASGAAAPGGRTCKVACATPTPMRNALTDTMEGTFRAGIGWLPIRQLLRTHRIISDWPDFTSESFSDSTRGPRRNHYARCRLAAWLRRRQ